MTLTSREFWTAAHGMLLGAAFLLAFTGSAACLWSLRSEWITPAGQASLTRMLMIACWSMAILAWLTVSIGTFAVYPWYRSAPPKGTPASALGGYPRFLLKSKPATSGWHDFGMEWKEHVGWLAPIFATGVAMVVTLYRRSLAGDTRVRQTLLVLLSLAFFSAAVAGLFGALINKMAPVR